MNSFIAPDGVWPVMVTPFKNDGSIDYNSLEKLVDWYIEREAAGLFAVCQSSEMFRLDVYERTELAKFIVKAAAGRVPVVVSGHVSESFADQVKEVNNAAQTGAAAVVLLSNRLAGPGETNVIFRRNLERLLKAVDEQIPLGIYECPYPYKFLLTPELVKFCADTGRFVFFKDTSCDIHLISEKLKVIKGTGFKLYNANAAFLLKSLQEGASGYSGVMANFHPRLYAWLCKNFHKQPELALKVSDFLGVLSIAESRAYPICAKYYLAKYINGMEIYSRVQSMDTFTVSFREEMDQLERLTVEISKLYGLPV